MVAMSWELGENTPICVKLILAVIEFSINIVSHSVLAICLLKLNVHDQLKLLSCCSCICAFLFENV